MTRRALGRGRLIVVVGAIVALAGIVPPWWRVGGTVTPAISGNGFEGAGILVFLAALGLLALVVLPFTRREGEAAIDRPSSYVLLAMLAIGGFILRVLEINGMEALALPDRAPGLWLSGAGLLIVAWGVAELLNERRVEF
ncbi:MAG TPA: hypothetical protein VMP67_10335 [Candidatus Limnocylindria bacterium]|nr:hypothetical protein [Candidatus Limnocylindria bacterium]